MTDYSKSLLDSLSLKVKKYPRFSLREIEKFCWMAAHEYKHGVLPSEYDIREIDENLYLQLLKKFETKSKSKCQHLSKMSLQRDPEELQHY